MSFRFAYPLLLAVLLFLILLWLFIRYKRKPAALTYSWTSALSRLAGTGSQLKARIPMILRTIGFILLALAAGRPQLYNVSHETQTPGVDIILCLDTSGTMKALDFKLDNEPVTRLTAVKKVVTDFIKKREFDRIGLVVFGDAAYTQAPLTLDKGLLLQLVENMEVGMAGERTAIGDAIAVSAKRLKDLNAPSKILILLTDGRHNAGSLAPAEAAAAAASLGIKIYTIGVGSKGEAPFKVETFFGERLVYQQVDLDEQSLLDIAKTGNGRFFLASDTKSLADIYNLIDQAEKREVKVKEFLHFKELYQWCLIPGIFLVLLALGLEITILRVVP